MATAYASADMAGESEEDDLTELRALIASNAEAMEKLRDMLQRLELTIETLSSRSVPPNPRGDDPSAGRDASARTE